MGRQNKVGLDYFELDCHMDEKVRLIQAEYGLKGFAVVVKLYQEIYGGHGYYCEWTQDRELLFASENGLNGGSFINNIVAACIKRDIFSERLFKEYGVLSSTGVQKQYLKATVKREVVELKKEYLLISIPKNRENVVISTISGGRNAISDGRNTHSRVEKSREDISDDGVINIYYRAREASDELINTHWGRAPTNADVEHVRSLIITMENGNVQLNDDRLELLKYAFECSVLANAMNWNYVHGVFERLKERNINTLDEAYSYDIKREYGGNQYE